MRLLALLLLASPLAADVVVLANGKKLEDVVVSRQDDEWVIVNPWNSRHPEMTWGLEDEHRIPRAKVAEVIVGEPPLIELRMRESKRGLDAAEHLALAALCLEHKLKPERERHLRLARAADPANAEAAALLADSKFERWAKGNPLVDPELARLEGTFLRTENDVDLAPLWREMKALRTTRDLAYLVRARRSGAQPKGIRQKVPLTWRSEESPGANYCIQVPDSYDPLVATPLVIGLHGGGPGGVDETLVTGSGEAAMPFYQREAAARGWIVVCPTAVAAPWNHAKNGPWLEALLEELLLFYNVDETRIYLTGHSMGGFGTWHWGPEKADVWAACSPCAGGGGPNGIQSTDLPIYVFHGTDDAIVRPDWDRTAAKALSGGKRPHDFVYTELDGVGHGFPGEVREAIFEFFSGRRKDGKQRALEPVSSFDRKVGKGEKKAFGDPSKLPEGDEGGARVKDLLAAIEKGGGAGAAAVEELAGHRDDKTARLVGRILNGKKSSVDARVLAARTLGLMAVEKGLSPLARALDDDDWRVLEEATVALGKTGLAKAVPPLETAAQRLGERYDGSFYSGRRMTHTEYAIRLGGFGKLCDAYAALADADAALPALERELVARVFLPDDKPEDTTDERFVREPPAARRALVERLAACFVALEDERGIALLRSVADAWEGEAPLVRAAEKGIEQLEKLRAGG